jgi:hypothetical protein
LETRATKKVLGFNTFVARHFLGLGVSSIKHYDLIKVWHLIRPLFALLSVGLLLKLLVVAAMRMLVTIARVRLEVILLAKLIVALTAALIWLSFQALAVVDHINQL